MKTSLLKTIGVVFALFFYTAKTSVLAIFNYFFSNPSRASYDQIIHHWVDQLLNEVRVKYVVINPHQTAPELGKATILMCNHSSAFDIPLGFKAFPNHSVRMLSKKELSKVPLLGKAMSAAGFPFIDRKNRYQAIKDLVVARELMESGIVLWIAPEGTRSKDGQLAPFKKGAFITAIEAQATIIPMGIRGAFNILPTGSLRVNLDQQAEIHIGESIDASQFTLDNKEQLISQTFEAIKQLVGENSFKN